MGDDPVKVEIVHPADLGPDESALWTRIRTEDSRLASPFLSPAFAAACSRARPQTRVRVGVFSTAEGVTGFFPHEYGRGGFAQALAQGYSDVQGLVAPASADVDFPALLRACGLRSWRFDHLLGCQERWLADAPHYSIADSSPVVDVSAGWGPYESAQRRHSTSLFQSTARKRRKLERDHGPVSLTFHEPDHSLLEQVLTLKSDQYRRSGWRDRLADAGVRSLFHDLLDVHEADLRAPLTVLRAGDEVVAAHVGLRSSTSLAWWVPVYWPRFSDYSPGLVLCLELIRVMGDEGLTTLDLGKGDEAYKRRLANAELPLLRGSVSRDRWIAQVDATRRWPQDRVLGWVLGSPRLRGLARGALARLGAARVRRADAQLRRERVGAAPLRQR